MTHTIPKLVADLLAQRLQAKKVAEALFQEQVNLVTSMLGIPEGTQFNLNLDACEIVVPDPPEDAA